MPLFHPFHTLKRWTVQVPDFSDEEIKFLWLWRQIMHCKCPKNSVSYLIKRHAYDTGSGTGFQYSFACSPQTVIYFFLSLFIYLFIYFYPSICLYSHTSIIYIIYLFQFQKLRCQRKEPCKLFSVRKNPSRPSADEVSTSSLCQCPHRRKCPKHHLDVGVIPGKVYSDDSVRTYSGYCM